MVAIAPPALSIGFFSIEFAPGSPIHSISLALEDSSFLITLFSMVISLLAVFIGGALIYSEWNNTSRSIAKVLISSLPNTNLEFPEYLLDPAEKEFFREPITIGLSSSTNEDIDGQISLYNAEVAANIFNRFIIHDKCKKLYIGGLARVPFLVSYGALLRNTGVDTYFFDKSHSGQRQWELLGEEKTNLDYLTVDQNILANANGDIAIAVSFTCEITEEQLPQPLRNHTLYIVPSITLERNLIKNQDNLSEAARYIASKIDQVSRRAGVDRVHLFLSIQAPLAIALGQCYQEGIHKKWIIHNFNAERGFYEWGLELSSSGVKRYASLELTQGCTLQHMS